MMEFGIAKMKIRFKLRIKISLISQAPSFSILDVWFLIIIKQKRIRCMKLTPKIDLNFIYVHTHYSLLFITFLLVDKICASRMIDQILWWTWNDGRENCHKQVNGNNGEVVSKLDVLVSRKTKTATFAVVCSPTTQSFNHYYINIVFF